MQLQRQPLQLHRDQSRLRDHHFGPRPIVVGFETQHRHRGPLRSADRHQERQVLTRHPANERQSDVVVAARHEARRRPQPQRSRGRRSKLALRRIRHQRKKESQG